MEIVLRRLSLLVALIVVIAGCATPTPLAVPTAVPTEPPTSTPVPPTATATATATTPPTATSTETLVPTNTPQPTATATNTPAPTATLTKTPKPAPTKVVTPKPTATQKVSTPPLRDAIVAARNAVESIGGAMDRIYHGGGGESCSAFMNSYLTVLKSPTYDVSTQPSNVQGAYAQYRQGVEFAASSKIAQIAKICMQGGGSIGNLDFNEARQAVSTAGGMLTDALSTLGQ